MITKSQVIEVLPYFKRILAEHPDMTLEEMFDYVEREEEKSKKKDDERKRMCNEWFKDLVGKKCIIDFKNGYSYLIFEITHVPPNSYYNESSVFEAYSIYKSKKEAVVKKEKRAVMTSWFGCPFYEQKNEGVAMRILSDDDYEEVCKKFDKIIEELTGVEL